jgi:SNF2 family DNA or RNA helicase
MKRVHRYPYGYLYVPANLKDSLEQIPGIKYEHWQDRFHIPHHAIEPVNNILNGQSVRWEWAIEPDEPKTWAEYAAVLQDTELRDWVLDGFLTQYQKSAIECTGHMVGCHFWHPTGAGKTLSAILWSLLSDGPIIVVTRAASRLQYGREFERFTTIRPYVIRPLTKKNQITLMDYLMSYKDGDRKVVVVAWESLANNIDQLEELAKQGATVIFDESHRGKSSKRWEKIPLPNWTPDSGMLESTFMKIQEEKAKRRGGFIPKDQDGAEFVMLVPANNMTTASSRIAQAASRVVCTTATPIKDRTRDLWAQLDLAEPYAWGASSKWFLRYCNARPNRFGGMDTSGSSNLDELKSRLEYCTHSIDYRDTHRQLPPKRRQSFYVSPEDQCRATGGFAAEIKAASKIGGTAELEVRLAQAASMKRKAVIDLIVDHVENNQKVVVFTGRRRDCEELGKALKKHKSMKNRQVWAAHGGTSSGQRQQIVDKYMAQRQGCCLVGTGDAFGESLNMQDTDAALFIMLPYTAGQIRQWEGRFCRLGQKRPVVIYYVIAENTVDEHIADILINKMDAIEAVVGDVELAEAKYAIGGIEDEDAIVTSILEKL